jgi:hypothetical protein
MEMNDKDHRTTAGCKSVNVDVFSNALPIMHIPQWMMADGLTCENIINFPLLHNFPETKNV